MHFSMPIVSIFSTVTSFFSSSLVLLRRFFFLLFRLSFVVLDESEEEQEERKLTPRHTFIRDEGRVRSSTSLTDLPIENKK